MSKHWKFAAAGLLAAGLLSGTAIPAFAATPADTLVVAKADRRHHLARPGGGL